MGRHFPYDNNEVVMENIKCDFCGSEHCARILYGRIRETEQLRKELESGRFVLGGCMLYKGMPHWRCLDCGKTWEEKKKNLEQ